MSYSEKTAFDYWLEDRYPDQAHPERRDNEVFMGNWTTENFPRLGFKGKRLGNTARMNDGSTMVDRSGQEALFPAFVDRLEAEMYFGAQILGKVKI